MRPHTFETHADHEADSQICRFVCSGGLAACTVCNGAEGTLTTECPGEPMPPGDGDRVYRGELDFFNGAWEMLAPGLRPPEPTTPAPPDFKGEAWIRAAGGALFPPRDFGGVS